MCHTAILPTTLSSSQSDNQVIRLTYIFNRWLKMLKSYGRLDETSLSNDFSVIAKVIKSTETSSTIKKAVTKCRDLALVGSDNLSILMKALRHALTLMCNEQEDTCIRSIKQSYADQGMTERYRPLSKRLKKETIRKIGRTLSYTNVHTDSPETTKLVRRFVEKRAAQTVFKQSGKSHSRSNRFRQSVRRAVSFSLYNATFTDYDAQKRAYGTHWKVTIKPSTGEKVLKSKHCYLSFEEALAVCNRYAQQHPEDPYPMVPYLCDHCGKWHIGHDRTSPLTPPQQNLDIQHAS